MKRYTVADENELVSGTAQDILGRILVRPGGLATDLKGLNVDQYADLLIRNAGWYLSSATAEQFADIKFPSKYDRALSLLSIIPASNTHILTTDDSIE